MSSCDGVIIVAYERKFFSSGIERRGGAQQRPLADEKYTTAWNHIESAIAFALHLPIYVICENGLTEEGLIESKVDWFVNHLDFTGDTLSSPGATDSIRAWITDRVIPHSRKPKSLLSLAAKLKLSEMTGEEWTAILALLGATFGLEIGAAKLLPAIFH
jgi:hypothetical protein